MEQTSLNESAWRDLTLYNCNIASMGKWLSIKKELEKDNVTQCGEREQEREREIHTWS